MPSAPKIRVRVPVPVGYPNPGAALNHGRRQDRNRGKYPYRLNIFCNHLLRINALLKFNSITKSSYISDLNKKEQVIQ
jgi:hypothetical protein